MKSLSRTSLLKVVGLPRQFRFDLATIWPVYPV